MITSKISKNILESECLNLQDCLESYHYKPRISAKLRYQEKTINDFNEIKILKVESVNKLEITLCLTLTIKSVQ